MQTLTYLRPSRVTYGVTGLALKLETSGGRTLAGATAHPRLFSGTMAAPQATAAALLAVAEVAAANYYAPAPPVATDPVVTATGDRLRFEAFSACGGVYIRLDE